MISSINYELLLRPSASENIKLSICIPTYNRAAFIGATLESIFSQFNELVEVVIQDGGSTDDTFEVVLPFRERLPNLVYHRDTVNNGVDQDMATAVEIARGEYCWLMSSDDLIKPDAISTILQEIASNDDIYLCDITLCDSQMRPIRNSSFLSSRRTTDRFDLNDRVQFLTYLGLATSNNALFSYMSSIVFRRARWLEVGYNNLFSGTGYAHVFTLFSFLKKRCFVKYVPIPMVLNRSDNDSFSIHGLENRYLLDFDGYLLLANELFSHDPFVRTMFLKTMTREHPWYRILKFSSSIQSLQRWTQISTKLLEFGYPRWMLLLCGVLGRIRFVVKVTVYLNKRFGSSSFFRLLRGRF